MFMHYIAYELPAGPLGTSLVIIIYSGWSIIHEWMNIPSPEPQ